MWPGSWFGLVEGDECGDGADAADIAGQGLTLVDVTEEGGVDEVEGVVGRRPSVMGFGCRERRRSTSRAILWILLGGLRSCASGGAFR